MDNITLKKMNQFEKSYMKWGEAKKTENSSKIKAHCIFFGCFVYFATAVLFAKSGIIESSGDAIAIYILLTATGPTLLWSYGGAYLYEHLIFPAYVKIRENKSLKMEREIFQLENGISILLGAVDRGFFSYPEFINHIKNEIDYRISKAKEFKKEFKDHYFEDDKGISEIAKQKIKITELN